jgi:predicted ATP-grasp superfamily ATP-dependent carboligase
VARILVLDGHSPAGLALTRSLGRAGHWVAVGSNQGMLAPADRSRYCRLRFKYPVPSDNVPGFVEAVLQFARPNKLDLIIPVTDWTVIPLSKFRDAFQGICRLALGPHSALEIAADKYRTISLARDLQIPIPQTALVRSLQELDSVTCSSTFPVVVKDRFSARWEGDRAVLGSVAYAYSKDDLRAKVATRLKQAGDVLIQQFVAGSGVGFSALATEQGIYLPFMWRRVRETDPRGSGSSASESVPLDEQLRGSSSLLIMRVGLQALSMVEFKVPLDGGPPVLMEINARPWGSMQLAISCGIDYPVALVAWMLEGELPAHDVAYRPGITCRRLVGELTHLENTFRGAPPGWPLPYPNFLKTLLKVSNPWFPGVRYSDLSLTDPIPGLAGLARWFGAHLSTLKS